MVSVLIVHGLLLRLAHFCFFLTDTRLSLLTILSLLAMAGHVDAGKSTLMGHLLYLCGNVKQREMHKNRTESTKVGVGSQSHAS